MSGLTIAQKIIRSHLVSGDMIPGSEIALRIDRHRYHGLPGV